MMAVVTVDSGNMEQFFAEANGEEVKSSHALKAEKPATEKARDNSVSSETPASDAKPEAKPEAKAAEAKPEAEDDLDDVEGEDGLTARQKRELSAKMLKAIGKKHRQVKEAEEFAADQIRLARAAERRAEEAERELNKTRAATKPEPEAVEPVRENFATETEYIDAKIQWGVDQGIAKREAERAESQRRSTVAAQLAKAAGLVPDFEAVTSANLNWPGPVAQYMRDSDMFAELGYYFAKRPAELEKIAAMHPLKQLVAIGKIESTLQPFGSRSPASDPEPSGEKPETNGKGDKPAPSTDTGFSPSKARSDAPVIKPLNDGGQAIDPEPSSMNTREMIQAYQKAKGINLTVRKRH
jgi:hypothetical protein